MKTPYLGVRGSLTSTQRSPLIPTGLLFLDYSRSQRSLIQWHRYIGLMLAMSIVSCRDTYQARSCDVITHICMAEARTWCTNPTKDCAIHTPVSRPAWLQEKLDKKLNSCLNRGRNGFLKILLDLMLAHTTNMLDKWIKISRKFFFLVLWLCTDLSLSGRCEIRGSFNLIILLKW